MVSEFTGINACVHGFFLVRRQSQLTQGLTLGQGAKRAIKVIKINSLCGFVAEGVGFEPTGNRSTSMFRAAIQFTINAIFNPSDRKNLQPGSGLATDPLAIDLKTVAPLAGECFANAELDTSMLHECFQPR
ncbi:hypothetical protein [Bradyrhizobium sp. USDA 3315]